MSKINLYIDMDSTLIQTIPCLVDLINEDNGLNINHIDVKMWNFEDVVDLPIEHINNLFEDCRFFENVKLFPNVREVLMKYKYKFNYYIVTKGSERNLLRKIKWVKQNIPEIDVNNFIGLEYNGSMDKSSVDMSRGIVIDDNQDCLFSSNADIKIMMFEKERGICQWNDKWNGTKVDNWYEIDELLGEI